MTARFAGQTVIVTGASRGLGRAIAAAFGAEGAYVVVGYRARVEEATESLRLVREAGGDGVAIPFDVGDRAAVDAAGIVHCAVAGHSLGELAAWVRRRALACPLIANRDGRVAAPDTIPDRLAEQLTHPVCWTRTLETLSALGISDHVTAGPGTVLRGLSRRCLGESVRVHGTEDAADRRRTLAALRGSSHPD